MTITVGYKEPMCVRSQSAAKSSYQQQLLIPREVVPMASQEYPVEVNILKSYRETKSVIILHF